MESGAVRNNSSVWASIRKLLCAVRGLCRKKQAAPCPAAKGDETKMQTLELEATNENLSLVNEFIDGFLEEHDCPMRAQMQIDLCVEEIFVNIANYAYGEKTGTARIGISQENGVFTLVFEDAGMAYDPLKKPDPDITLSAEDRQIGGLGIYLVKKNMGTVSYRRENGRNVLTLTKSAAPGA